MVDMAQTQTKTPKDDEMYLIITRKAFRLNPHFIKALNIVMFHEISAFLTGL
jgi:hypothetical protein